MVFNRVRNHLGDSNQAARLASALFLLSLCTVTAFAKSACPDGCHTYGTCYEPLGRCDCPWNRTGLACLQIHRGFCLKRPDINTCNDGHPTLCVNACNSRGRCMGGFCHCQPGYFGTDCSLSLGPDGKKEVLLDGLGYRPASKGPKVYVYEIPPEFHVKRNNHKVDRPPMHLAIMERLLSSGHRTANGEEADYFYVPVASRDLKKSHSLMPVIDYISSNWPFWNRTLHGKGHIMCMDGDVGTCELPLHVRVHARNTTWLQFWGMHDFHPSWGHIFHNRIPCSVPGRDIVVPFMAMSSHDRFVIETPLRPGNPQPERNITFFFSGGICGSGRYNALPPNCTYYKQLRYSGGVRQAVYENFHTRPKFRVVPRTDNYARDYATSTFCLAAPGGGWGKRGIVAAMYGCIPVSATDFLHEAFEPEMDWARFGVRVAQKDIPSLGTLLESFSQDQIENKRKRTACAAQHFHWSSSLGGIMKETGEFDAFATIMAILDMRKRYPDIPPQDYYNRDEGFRNFMDCVPARGARMEGVQKSQSQRAGEGEEGGNRGEEIEVGRKEGKGVMKDRAVNQGLHTQSDDGGGSTVDGGGSNEGRGGQSKLGSERGMVRNSTSVTTSESLPTRDTVKAEGVNIGFVIGSGERGNSSLEVRAEEREIGRGSRNSQGSTYLGTQAELMKQGSQRKRRTLCTMFVGPGQFEKYPWMDDVCPQAVVYMRRKVGPPGGVTCVNVSNAAQCWRVGE